VVFPTLSEQLPVGWELVTNTVSGKYKANTNALQSRERFSFRSPPPDCLLCVQRLKHLKPITGIDVLFGPDPNTTENQLDSVGTSSMQDPLPGYDLITISHGGRAANANASNGRPVYFAVARDPSKPPVVEVTLWFAVCLVCGWLLLLLLLCVCVSV
jgi:hypothetical protein